MDGVVKAMRRGGWSARGLIAAVRHGQLFETQVGPREFPSKQAAIDWLRRAAADRAVRIGQIVVSPSARPGRAS